MKTVEKLAVVIPNLNGEDYLAEAIDSLLNQTVETTVIVVDNASTDKSREIIQGYGDKIVSLYNDKNLGFDGGVNTGIRYALKNNFDTVALFNNDAVADKNWLRTLVDALKDDVGIVTGCLQSINKKTIDSTGDLLTNWGLPYPRGRGSSVEGSPYTTSELVFGASGGASLYSAAMLKEIGIFDEDFFAYYEDVDISFRAQLAGWRVRYVPDAIAYHRISATTNSMRKGFTVYQTFKNMPMVMVKNIPRGLRHRILPRFWFAYLTFFVSALSRGQGWSALKGYLKFLTLYPKKLRERKQIQAQKKVSNEYIWGILTHDLPENSRKLRKLREIYWKLTGKSHV